MAVSMQVTRVINPAVGCHYYYYYYYYYAAFNAPYVGHKITNRRSVRPAVTLASLKRADTNFAAW